MATALTKSQVVVNQTKAQQEENIESITEGVLPPYLKSMFSNLASANLQNAQILYNFLLTGHVEQNLALRTSLNHMQILCYFNRYLAIKELADMMFDKLQKGIVDNALTAALKLEKENIDSKEIVEVEAGDIDQ